MSELRGLQLRIDEFRELGARVAAICVDPVEKNREVAQRLGLSYPILADPEREAIRAFDLLHEDANPFGDGAIARPATFIVKDGRVRWRDLTSNWRVRPGADAVLTALRGVLSD
jgi:peroxiredoxin